MRERRKLGVTLVLVAASFGAFARLAAQADDAAPDATGLIEPTDEDSLTLLQRKVLGTHANRIAIARANIEREKRGEPRIDQSSAATPAEEIVTATLASGAAAHLVTALPSEADNSTLAAFPPIGKQGHQNSCVAWATTYYQLSHETALARGGSNASRSSPTVFSPKWTYNMINKGQNKGTANKDAYMVLAKHGAASLSELPYDGDFKAWDLDPAHWRNAISFRTHLPYAVMVDTKDGVANAKQLLANGHVLCLMTHLKSWQYTTVKDDPSTSADDAFVGQKAMFWKNGKEGAHMMTIVGYDDSVWIDVNGDGVVDPGEKGAFKVANQFGTTWGNDGFMWVAYDALNATSQVPNGPSDGRVPAFGLNMVLHSPARPSYTPTMLAEVTVKTARRGQLSLTLGVSPATTSTPTSTWTPGALSNRGGPFAFDGGTTAVSGTFVLDFSDLVPAGASSLNYYLTIADSMPGFPTGLQGFRLIDTSKQEQIPLAGSFPIRVDGSSATVSLAHTTNVDVPPVAAIAAHTDSTTSGAVVVFDGSGSKDADGTVVSWEWCFGDGSAGESSPTATHVYKTAGTFIATLTVVDDRGRKGRSSFPVTVAPRP